MWTLLTLSTLAVLANAYYNEPCTKYGCELVPPVHEPFVPAVPGYTPKCAKPGLTFCTSLDQYPEQLIKFLIEKRGIDYDQFLKDESADDFDSLRREPDYNSGYDYPKPQAPPQLYPKFVAQAQTFIVHRAGPVNVSHNSYSSSGNPFLLPNYPQSYSQSFAQRSTALNVQQSFGYQQSAAVQQQQHQQQGARPQYHQPLEFFDPNQQDPWIPGRNSRTVAGAEESRGHTRYQNPLLEFASNSRQRSKRQSDATTVSICPTKTVSILPKAAVNNQGKWMYVVNIEDQKKHSQLVRTEVCQTDVCDGLCSLPLGYTSKCKQQYVQKRLIALGGDGESLYNDVFWFPSGCSCQVTINY